MNNLVRAVVGILRRDNKFLVAKRPEGKPYSGYWEFPGGKIEVNESAEHALTRELHEELGIHVLASQSWYITKHAYPDKTVELHLWLVTEFSGEPHSKENQELRWATLDEMLSLKLLEGNWAVMERVKGLI